MTMTDGPVRTAPNTVKTLLRRPFRLNLPGSAPQAPHTTVSNAASSAPPAPAKVDTPSAPAMPKAKARVSPLAPRRPLAEVKHSPSTNAPTQTPAAPAAGFETTEPRSTKPQAQLSRPQILDATADCLDQAGYDGTTIRMIARSLDCAVGSIYRYFTDKRELLDAVVQQRFLPVAEAVEAGAELSDTLAQYHAAATTRPEQYRLMFWLAAVGRATDQPAAVPDVIQRILTGWSRQLDSKHDAQCQWAQIHGGIMLGIDLHCEQSTQ